MKYPYILIATLTLFLYSCASVDFDYPKPESTALNNTDDTTLGQVIAPIVAEHPREVSGFRLQLDGIDSLAKRLVVTQKAERSIDAQYYLIHADTIGYVFIYSLLLAADRGVRVRLLIDDIFTQGYDFGMAALDSHPNFEVRVFNPFASRTFRIGDVFTDFSRINRRMHNKTFIIDNQIAIVGGRNIASEYFGARDDVNFSDLDLVCIGPIVQEISNTFDRYWNDELAAAVPAFANMPEDPAAELEKLRDRLKDEMTKARETKYADAVKIDYHNYFGQLRDDIHQNFSWAPYTYVYDDPEKADKGNSHDGEKSVTKLKNAIDDANSELMIVTPYFVPGKRGVKFFEQLRERGIDITVITNSLSSNNHTVVHSGYIPYRKPLLKMGVKIYEARGDVTARGVERVTDESSGNNLHTKAFIIDREQIFVGSFNWDPRSVDINTEQGVIVKSPVLASLTASQVVDALDYKAYELYLNENNQLRWTDNSGANTIIYTKEPNTSWWKRFKANLMRILPIESQL